MPRVPKSQIPDLIRKREEFVGSSLQASYNDEGYYIVDHLGTVLATVAPDGEIWLLPESRLPKLVRASLKFIEEPVRRPYYYGQE